jgi:hypothetical protein
MVLLHLEIKPLLLLFHHAKATGWTLGRPKGSFKSINYKPTPTAIFKLKKKPR